MLLFSTSSLAFADGVNGVWKTEANDAGEYLEVTDGNNSYAGGKIWDPEIDKTYKSKMSIKGDDLDVEGCVSVVCIGEDWKRVE